MMCVVYLVKVGGGVCEVVGVMGCVVVCYLKCVIRISVIVMMIVLLMWVVICVNGISCIWFVVVRIVMLLVLFCLLW